MRKFLLLSLVLALFGLAGAATADEVYVPSISPGTSVNVYPFKASYGEWRYQLIIPPQPLGNQAFTVTDIAFNPKLGGALLCSLLEVRMGLTTAAVSSLFAVNLPNPTTVLSTVNGGWTTTAATWSPMGLQKSFNYDGTSSLVIEIRYTGGQMTGGFDGGCYYTSPSPSYRVGKYGTGAFNATSGTNWGLSGLAIRIDLVKASITPSGSGQIGTTVSFLLAAPADAGKPYQVGSSLGQGPIPLGGQSLPLSPDDLLSLSTTGLVPALFQNYAGVLDAKGDATAKIVIPNLPALKGVRFYTAFVTLDPARPLGIGIVSPRNVLITIS